MKDFNRRRFLGRLAATIAVGLVIPTVATAAGTIYINWWEFKKNKKTGVVTQTSSGTIGPFNQTEANSVLEAYRAKGSENKDFIYYYKAKIK